MNRNRAKKYLRKKDIEQQRIEMPNGGIQLHNLLADFEMYCLDKVEDNFNGKTERQILKEGYELRKNIQEATKRKLLEEIEIKQGKDGEPRYVLTQKQFDKL